MRFCALGLLLMYLISVPVLADDLNLLKGKYEFDELETVDRISLYRIDGWHALDNQSLILRTSPSKSYLVILQRPLPELRHTENIALSSTGSTVYARFDTVTAIDRFAINFPVHIEKIYKLDGKEQRQAVTKMIKRS